MPFWRRNKDRRAGEPPAGGAESSDALWLVVGLGNPGVRFAGTRHNIGFMVVERLAERYGLRFKGSKQRADIARGVVAGAPALLAMPLTYMNESGNAVSRLLGYYRVPLDRLLVVYDEIDLPFGTIRLRPSGSAAGNRGLRSIIQATGSEEFSRLRLGVGRPRGEAVSHVLGRFPPEQERLLPQLLDIACDCTEAVLAGDVGAAMNRFNRNWLDELSQ
jgi:PTH1 family peptidyl-tRNA hydrolase